jgi:hypothetical protein
MQGTTEVQHQIADARLPQAAPVFDDATALPPAVDGRDPAPAPVECRGPGSRGNGRGRGLLAPPGRSPLASWRHRRGGHRAQDWQKGASRRARGHRAAPQRTCRWGSEWDARSTWRRSALPAGLRTPPLCWRVGRVWRRGSWRGVMLSVPSRREGHAWRTVRWAPGAREPRTWLFRYVISASMHAYFRMLLL